MVVLVVFSQVSKRFSVRAIDANDVHKTTRALRFLQALLSNVPLLPLPSDDSAIALDATFDDAALDEMRQFVSIQVRNHSNQKFKVVFKTSHFYRHRLRARCWSDCLRCCDTPTSATTILAATAPVKNTRSSAKAKRLTCFWYDFSFFYLFLSSLFYVRSANAAKGRSTCNADSSRRSIAGDGIVCKRLLFETQLAISCYKVIDVRIDTSSASTLYQSTRMSNVLSFVCYSDFCRRQVMCATSRSRASFAKSVRFFSCHFDSKQEGMTFC